MVKYFKELEKPNDFCLNLVEHDWKFENDKYIQNAKVPIEFFNKYSKLFSIIDDLYLIVKNIDFDIDSNKIIENFKVGLIEYDATDNIFLLENLLYDDFKYIEERQKSLTVNIYDIEAIFNFYKDITIVLETIYVNRKQEFNNIREHLKTALKELKKYNIIKCEIDKKRKIELPNAWYITPYNDLYNTTDTDGRGHKQANLKYPFLDGREKIKLGVVINSSNCRLESRNRIIKSNCINDYDYKFTLNYIYHPAYIVHKECFSKSYDPNIVKIALGVYSAQAGLYKFFEDLQKYTNNPSYEFDKIIEITKGDINDILVRCAGFHKMVVCETKTIATSNPLCGNEFSEYLKRGWNVSYIPPIIINKEKRVVGELDSIISDRIIEKDREGYEKKRQLGYGKIF